MGHANLGWQLNALSLSFALRFECTGGLRKCIQLTPEYHADLPIWLSNLGLLHHRCFQRTGDTSDLSAAITLKQKCIHLTPKGHADLVGRPDSLGCLLQARFDRKQHLDISEAVSLQRRCVQLITEGHANLHVFLNNLGASLQSRFQHKTPS